MWWSFHCTNEALQYLNKNSDQAKLHLAFLTHCVHFGALFTMDESQEKFLEDMAIYDYVINQWVIERGKTKPERESYLIEFDEASNSLKSYYKASFCRSLLQTRLKGVHDKEKTELYNHVKKFVTISSGIARILVFDPYALSMGNCNIEDKMRVISLLFELLDGIDYEEDPIKRQIKVVYSKDKRKPKNTIDEKTARDLIKANATLKNDCELYFEEADPYSDHGRVILLPWWGIYLDKGLETIKINKHGKVRMSSENAPVFTFPWPSSFARGNEPVEFLDGCRFCFSLNNKYGSCWDCNDGRVTKYLLCP